MRSETHNDPELKKYFLTVYLTVFAQIAIVISGLTIALLVYFIDLPIYYVSFILLFLILLIPNCIATEKIQKQRHQRRQFILENGIKTDAEIISVKLSGSGGDIEDYYSFELRPKKTDTIVTALELLTSDSYNLVSMQEVLPIRYLPDDNVAVVLLEEIA